MTKTTPISQKARHVLIGVNPHAGAQSRQSLIAQLQEQLTACGFEVAVIQSIDELAAEAQRLLGTLELRCVVSAGGDGTLRLIADRMPPGTPLGILPLGTENLLARYLEHSQDPADLTRLIGEGLTVRL